MATVGVSKLKNSAPGQYLGYGLQPVRMCAHLFDVPDDCMVSLEHLDDVAIHFHDGRLVLEQTKSALSGNPAADRSPELWKTMANWADMCATATIDVHKASFRYYVSPIKNGKLIGQLNEAKNQTEAKTLLSRFKTKIFIGKEGVGAQPHIKRFLAAGDDLCLQIIQSFEFASDADPLEAIKSKLTAALPADTIDQFCEAAIGQAKSEAEKFIRAKQPPLLNAGNYRKKFQEFILKYNFSNLLHPTREAPEVPEVEGIRGTLPIFVQQLETVEASDDLITTAISDYLRTTADKINWADEGDILEDSLNSMDDALLRHHVLTRDEIEDTLATHDENTRGRQLYRRCARLQMPLDNKSLPTYFVAGEYNCLADNFRLGWHPNYKKKFSGDQE